MCGISGMAYSIATCPRILAPYRVFGRLHTASSNLLTFRDPNESKPIDSSIWANTDNFITIVRTVPHPHPRSVADPFLRAHAKAFTVSHIFGFRSHTPTKRMVFRHRVRTAW